METMAAKRDYYEVLGIERTATRTEVAAAYRKQAVKYHPDKNPGDDDAVRMFKECAEAYEVLSDADKRGRYDRYGHAGVDGPGGGAHFNDVNDIFEAFGDIFGEGIFGDLFGQRRGRGGRRAQRGSDVRCELRLDLMEAAKGVTRRIRFERYERCETCQGSGAKPGTQPEKCDYCGGRGQVIQQSGIFRVQTNCPACHGSGARIKNPCGDCRGEGYVATTAEREVQVPAGVDTNTRLRLAGEGNPSPSGGPPGDCYVVIDVREHPLFTRDGQNLICQVPINYSQAALGAAVEVPTLNGAHQLELPGGTQHGDVFRLRGKGMPDPRYHGVGDLLVQVQLVVPKKLSERQEQLLRELAEEEQTNVSAHQKNFFEKLKDFFVSNEPAENSDEP